MNRKYENEMLQVIHEDVKGLHESGIISDAEMRKFDKLCLVQEPKPEYISSNLNSTTGAKPAVRISAKSANT